MKALILAVVIAIAATTAHAACWANDPECNAVNNYHPTQKLTVSRPRCHEVDTTMQDWSDCAHEGGTDGQENGILACVIPNEDHTRWVCD